MNTVNLKNATDAELLLAYQEGHDQSAFNEIVNRHGPMVMATTRRVSSSQEDCEDAFQATFFALAKAIDKLSNKAAVSGWLHTAATRSATQIQRDNMRWDRKTERIMERLNASPTGDCGSTNEPSIGIADEELRRILDKELASLPNHLHVPIVLCDLEGLSQNEAAKSLGIPLSTFNKHIAKGRKLLRDRLVPLGLSLPSAGFATLIASSSETSALTHAFITETTSRATLYAAGNSAAQIGVSEATIQTANMVVAAMTKTKLLSVFLTALALLAFSGSIAGLAGLHFNSVQAGTIFFEDFSDKNHTDSSPVTWHPVSVQPGDLDASSGEFVLSRNENSIAAVAVGADAKDIVIHDMSVRVVAKPTETNGVAGLAVRTQDPHDTTRGYIAGVGYSPNQGGSFLIAGLGLTDNGRVLFPSVGGSTVVNLPYDVREEFSELQIDVFDDQIKVWAWRSGTDMPLEPQFVATDSTYTEPGFVRIVAPSVDENIATGGTAIFRSVHMAAIPIHEIPKGDFDGNGTLDTTDIDLLNAQIQGGNNHSYFDLNADGLVTEDDRNVWVQDIAGTFLGDANLDFIVDSSDLNALALHWQQAVVSWAGGDFTGDGFVDAADLNVLALNWQNSVNSPASVPEPSSISLLLLSILFGSSIILGRGVAN